MALQKRMNRLILVGNGFDLAHKMKTRYYDFVFQYLKDCFVIAGENGTYTDELLKITRLRKSYIKIQEVLKLEELLKFNESDDFNRQVLDYLAGSSTRDPNEKDYSLKVTSPFFGYLLNHCGEFSWVDIENAYYDHLTKLIGQTSKVEDKLKALNQSFNYIITRLKSYLTNQKVTDLITEIPRILTEKIKKDDLVTIDLEDDTTPVYTLILNFNYTDSVYQYFSEPDRPLFGKKMPILHIHGKLPENDNPVIFGFGDELDKRYKLLEAEKRKGFLDYMKSFWYFKTSNYHELIRFIQYGAYQVFTLGHSCGLSDRTMLNMIFEHDNCKSIKIFPYVHNGYDNYTELTQEISRHFKDKGVMRKKIVNRRDSEPMPQLKT